MEQSAFRDEGILLGRIWSTILCFYTIYICAYFSIIITKICTNNELSFRIYLFIIRNFIFQKKYTWHYAQSIDVKDTWNHVAGVRYNDKLGKWRKKYGINAKPNSVPQEIWNNCWQYWNSDEFKTLFEQASQNWRSEKGGDGSGISKHIGGSKSTILHFIDLVIFFCLLDFMINFFCMQLILV